jgi:hypothetical protein
MFWPISTCGMISVTSPYPSILMKAFGAKVAASAAARVARSGPEKPNRKAVAADISRKARRDRPGSSSGTEEEARETMCRAWRSRLRRCVFDRLPDTQVGPGANARRRSTGAGPTRPSRSRSTSRCEPTGPLHHAPGSKVKGAGNGESVDDSVKTGQVRFHHLGQFSL